MLPCPYLMKFQTPGIFHIRSYATYAIFFMLDLEKLWWAWVTQIGQALYFFLQKTFVSIVPGLATTQPQDLFLRASLFNLPVFSVLIDANQFRVARSVLVASRACLAGPLWLLHHLGKGCFKWLSWSRLWSLLFPLSLRPSIPLFRVTEMLSAWVPLG